MVDRIAITSVHRWIQLRVSHSSEVYIGHGGGLRYSSSLRVYRSSVVFIVAMEASVASNVMVRVEMEIFDCCGAKQGQLKS